jgi:tRNA-dihydrouridine synthase
MLGRGAIADPLLFERLRGRANQVPDREERGAMLRLYLRDLLARYLELFCGEAQVLGKIKGILEAMEDPPLEKSLGQLRKAKTVRAFTAILDELE